MHRLTKRDESLLRVVLESLLDGVAAVDAEGNVLFINDAMARLLGFATSSTLPDIKLTEALARVEAFDETGRRLAFEERPLIRALKGQAVTDIALRMYQPLQKRTYDVLNSALPIFDEDGSVRMAVIRMRDVTDQRRAIEALQESEERYQLATHAIEAMIYDWDIPTGAVVRSEGIESVLGYAAGDIVPQRSWWLSLVHPEDAGELVSSRDALMADRVERGVSDYRIRHRDGRWVHVKDRFLAFYAKDGSPARIVGSVIDVTRETMAAQALADSELRYRSLFENASDIVAVLDRDQRILSINAAVETILGLEPEEVTGRTLSELLGHTESAPIEPGTFELRARARNRTQDIALEVRANALLDGRGRQVGLHLIARDVTERRLAEARQTLLMRELQHRTKNILAVVQSLATNTLRNATSLAEAHDALVGRLHAVAIAQEFVSTGSGGAPLRALVEGEVAAYPGRTTSEGPDLMVNSAFAQTFALVVHELVTNAAKYGALSTPQGSVDIKWSIAKGEEGDVFHFTWVERDGPPVTPPDATGFGHKIIGLLGQPTLQFDPQGLRYRVEVPMADLVP